jgi:hypothetical protein
MPTFGPLFDCILRGGRCIGVGLIPLLGCGCSALKAGDALPPFDAQSGAVEASASGGGGSDATTDGPDERSVSDSRDDIVGDSIEAGPVDAAQEAPPSTVASPLAVVPTHLRLWLTADRGIACVSGRVARWTDQSGHSNDATLQSGQLGPLCGPQNTAHRINGINVPYFSAPANGNVVDETLDVDLSFLANTGYTILVVERRWYDAPNANWSENLVGTNIQAEANLNLVCASRPRDSVLQFGYVYYQGPPQLSFDQECDGVQANMAAAPAAPPAPVRQDTAMFDPALGHVLWSDGLQLAGNASVAPLLMATDGAVGRGVVRTTATGLDGRFRGDIAEVVVYDAALADAERVVVEGYLKGHWKY